MTVQSALSETSETTSGAGKARGPGENGPAGGRWNIVQFAVGAKSPPAPTDADLALSSLRSWCRQARKPKDLSPRQAPVIVHRHDD